MLSSLYGRTLPSIHETGKTIAFTRITVANRRENNGNSDSLYFGGLQNHCGYDCSHEIKKQLLHGRQAMANLDSMLKSRDIAVPTKVHIVKVIDFPVVMYECESWTIKKSEC